MDLGLGRSWMADNNKRAWYKDDKRARFFFPAKGFVHLHYYAYLGLLQRCFIHAVNVHMRAVSLPQVRRGHGSYYCQYVEIAH